MNIWDIIITALIALMLIMAVRSIVKNKKAGKCTCGCEGCAAGCDKKNK
ncbi:MAG: FeoB-associated Cys-rich membrane protein [Oscillospiraceae bacterium]|nr:FeoB-associated Cys-rich membrane protein [Oscillospiraceae bacterium]